MKRRWKCNCANERCKFYVFFEGYGYKHADLGSHGVSVSITRRQARAIAAALLKWAGKEKP
jgi:hypothetical protein